MTKSMYPADNIDSAGNVYPTVGENIRNGVNNEVTVESMCNAIKDNTDRAKMCDKLDTTASEFKTALLMLLTGKTAHFGGLDVDAFSSSELAEIKAYLGVV